MFKQKFFRFVSFILWINLVNNNKSEKENDIFFVSYKENETQSTYSLSPAIVIVSKNKLGSLCCLASLCQFAKNSMGFSGAFSMNDKPDVSIFLVSQLTQIWSVCLVSRLSIQCSAWAFCYRLFSMMLISKSEQMLTFCTNNNSNANTQTQEVKPT